MLTEITRLMDQASRRGAPLRNLYLSSMAYSDLCREMCVTSRSANGEIRALGLHVWVGRTPRDAWLDHQADKAMDCVEVRNPAVGPITDCIYYGIGGELGADRAFLYQQPEADARIGTVEYTRQCRAQIRDQIRAFIDREAPEGSSGVMPNFRFHRHPTVMYQNINNSIMAGSINGAATIDWRACSTHPFAANVYQSWLNTRNDAQSWANLQTTARYYSDNARDAAAQEAATAREAAARRTIHNDMARLSQAQAARSQNLGSFLRGPTMQGSANAGDPHAAPVVSISIDDMLNDLD